MWIVRFCRRYQPFFFLMICMACDAAAESITSGKDIFAENCAVCHGTDGKGRGVFTSMLRVPPPNLTILAKINGGEFPDKFVKRALEGINMPGAHGTREMPIWGARWRAEGEGSAGSMARVIAVMAYLETIQE